MLLAASQGPAVYKGHDGKDEWLPSPLLVTLFHLHLTCLVHFTHNCNTERGHSMRTESQSPDLCFTGPWWTRDLTGVLWTHPICHRWVSTGE